MNGSLPFPLATSPTRLPDRPARDLGPQRPAESRSATCCCSCRSGWRPRSRRCPWRPTSSPGRGSSRRSCGSRIGGHVKPLPGGTSALDQVMRPIVLTQLLFAVYNFLSSVFYVADLHGFYYLARLSSTPRCPGSDGGRGTGAAVLRARPRGRRHRHAGRDGLPAQRRVGRPAAREPGPCGADDLGRGAHDRHDDGRAEPVRHPDREDRAGRLRPGARARHSDAPSGDAACWRSRSTASTWGPRFSAGGRRKCW